MKTAKDTLKDRYDEYARRFIDQGMEPVTFDRWLLQIAADREMWGRHHGETLPLAVEIDNPSAEAGSSSLAFLACTLLALVPVSLVVVFVARLAGAVAGVMG